MDVSKKRITYGVEYIVLRSERKTAAIEINREKGVILRLPLSFSESDIPNIILQNKAWILSKLEKQSTLPLKPVYDEKERKILKKKAKEIIAPIVLKYSEIMKLYPTAVKINFAKTRFGSCSPKNSINFSAYLLNCPLDAVEYVVVHELAHIKYKNHSKEFYILIEKYLPDYKDRIKLLKKS